MNSLKRKMGQIVVNDGTHTDDIWSGTRFTECLHHREIRNVVGNSFFPRGRCKTSSMTPQLYGSIGTLQLFKVWDTVESRRTLRVGVGTQGVDGKKEPYPCPQGRQEQPSPPVPSSTRPSSLRWVLPTLKRSDGLHTSVKTKRRKTIVTRMKEVIV